MKFVLFFAFTFCSLITIGQTNSSTAQTPVDSMSIKVAQLQQRMDQHQQEVQQLKEENQQLKKQIGELNAAKQKPTRSRVVIDRRGSKQASVQYY
jgi:cell shape-determining protein MreC